jgi:hypothetical protein
MLWRIIGVLKYNFNSWHPRVLSGGQLHDPVASTLEKTHCLWTGGWMDSRVCLNTVKERNTSAFVRNRTPFLCPSSLSHCTAWKLLGPMYMVFFYHGATAPSGPGPPHYHGFTITFRHSTLRRAPLDEWSAERRDIYLTTHNSHKRQTSMIPTGFGPAIPASEGLRTYALHRAATGIGICVL